MALCCALVCKPAGKHVTYPLFVVDGCHDNRDSDLKKTTKVPPVLDFMYNYNQNIK